MYRRGYLPVITVKANEILEFGEKKNLKFVFKIYFGNYFTFTFHFSSIEILNITIMLG